MASYPTRGRVRDTDANYRKCESQKRGFPTRDAALNAAESMMDAGRVKPGCHITPYLGSLACHEWHVGNRIIVPIERSMRPTREPLA